MSSATITTMFGADPRADCVVESESRFAVIPTQAAMKALTTRIVRSGCIPDDNAGRSEQKHRAAERRGNGRTFPRWRGRKRRKVGSRARDYSICQWLYEISY